MKSIYSHDLFYSYILMQIIWLGLKESYHTTTTFFFFFFSFSFFNSSLSRFRNLSPISHQDLSQNFCFFFKIIETFCQTLRVGLFSQRISILISFSNHYTSKTWERERIIERECKKASEFVKQNWILNNIWKTLYVLNKRKIVYI